ncbi:MAG: ribonuclease P protein component 4 [Methanoregulaceae archaeon]|jgi:ribonuclease P protein subunit RPR2
MKERSRTPHTKKIAHERIDRLFAQARDVFSSHPEWSNHYVELARRIAARQRVRIDHDFRRQFCRHCSSYLVPGNTSRVRIHRGIVVVTCLSCGKRRRYRVVKSVEIQE